MATQPTTDDLSAAVAGSTSGGGSGGSSILPIPYNLIATPGSTTIALTFNYDAALFKGFSVRAGVADPPHDDVLDAVYLNGDGVHGEAKVTITGLTPGTLYYMDAATIGVDSTTGTRSPSISATTTGGGFLPSDLPGLILWLDTDSVSTTGPAVTSWPDQSGQGHDGNPVGTPTYASSPPGINVSLVNSYFTVGLVGDAITAPAAATFFFVGTTPSALAASNRVLTLYAGSGADFNPPNGYVVMHVNSTGGGQAATYCGGDINTISGISTSTTYAMCCVMDFAGPLQRLYANGTTATNVLTPPSLSTLDTLVVCGTTLSANPFAGSAVAVYAYSRGLDPGEIAQMKTYLAGKWAAYSPVMW